MNDKCTDTAPTQCSDAGSKTTCDNAPKSLNCSFSDDKCHAPPSPDAKCSSLTKDTCKTNVSCVFDCDPSVNKCRDLTCADLADEGDCKLAPDSLKCSFSGGKCGTGPPTPPTPAKCSSLTKDTCKTNVSCVFDCDPAVNKCRDLACSDLFDKQDCLRASESLHCSFSEGKCQDHHVDPPPTKQCSDYPGCSGVPVGKTCYLLDDHKTCTDTVPTSCTDAGNSATCAAVTAQSCDWNDGKCTAGGVHPPPKTPTGTTCDPSKKYSCDKLLAGKGNVYIVYPGEDKCDDKNCFTEQQAAKTNPNNMFLPPMCGGQVTTNCFKGDFGNFIPDGSFGVGDSGAAFLFMPNQDGYELDMWPRVYQEVIGLGATPDATAFSDGKGPKYCSVHENVTDIFWRGASNFRSKGDMCWTVSQAAPLRRFHVDGTLNTHLDGYSSGYYMAQGQIDGQLELYGQQYYTRNCNFNNKNRPDTKTGKYVTFNSNVNVGGSNMNNVFENCYIGQKSNADNLPSRQGMVQVSTRGEAHDDTMVMSGEIGAMAEKPYIYVSPSKSNRWTLCNPSIRAGSEQKNGASDITSECPGGEQIDFANVLVINPDDVPNPKAWKDILGKVGDAKDGFKFQAIVVTPGLYKITQTIELPQNVILLGIGYPTFQFAISNNTAGLSAKSSKGVRLAGIMLQPDNDTGSLSALLQFGDGETDAPKDYSEAGVLNDVFLRTFGWTDKMIDIQDPFTIVDHVWAWTADHSDYVGYANNGIVVGDKANDVTIHGAFVEHTSQSNIVWNGKKGSLIFQQTEIGYDYRKNKANKQQAGKPSKALEEIYPSGSTWTWGTKDGETFSGLKVTAQDDADDQFTAVGIGIYMYNRSGPVTVQTAISAPNVSCDNLRQMFVWTIPVAGYQSGQGPPNVVAKGVGEIVNVIDCQGALRPGANLKNIQGDNAYEVFHPSSATTGMTPGTPGP